MERIRDALLVLLLSAGVAPHALAEHLPVRLYTVADGLPSDRINALYTDFLGYLWIGTGDGLSRFDGYRFVNYDERDGLPGPIIRSVLETREGAFWVGTDHALCRFDPKPGLLTEGGSAPRFICRAIGAAPGGRMVVRLLEGKDGRLWVGSDAGLFLLDRPTGREGRLIQDPVEQPLPFPPTSVTAIAEDAKGGLWVGTSLGLVHRLRSGRTIPFTPFRDGTPQSVLDLLADRRGPIWVATARGLFRIALPLPAALESSDNLVLEDLARDPTVTGVRYYGGLDASEVFDGSLVQDADGAVRLLTGDLCEVGRNKLECTPQEKILPAEGHLREMAMDRSDGLWLGTESSGLVRLIRSGLTSFGHEDGLPNLRIRSIFETPSGELHVLAGQDLARWTGSRFLASRPSVPEAIHNTWGWNQIYVKDHEGDWWIAMADGLLRYPPVARTEDLARVGPKRVYTTKDGLSGNEIFRLYEDRRGDIWISTLGGGPDKLNRWERATDRIRHYAIPGPMTSKTPAAFAEDRAGDLWIGFSEGGLARLIGDHLDVYPPGESIPAGIVRELLVDGRGRIWMATTGGGGGVIENPESPVPRFSWYTKREGLSSNRVFSVTDDALGRIYFGTTRGVDRLDPATGQVRRYSVGDGLPATEVWEAQRDLSGDLWFGTSDGLARLHPAPDANEPEPPMLINLLTVDGVDEPVSDLGEVEIGGVSIGPGSRRVEIGFLGLTLARGGELRYQYRLRGASDAWSPPAPDRSVHFSNLAPGAYRFEVRAVAPSSMTSSRPAAVAFSVLPPFWRTWWFELAAAAGLITAAVTLHRRRTARLVEIERIRTRIAADLHDEVGAGLSEIALMGELWAQRENPSFPTDGTHRRIAATSRRLVDAMSDIVWAINPEKDRVFSLSQRMRRFATTLLRAAGVTLHFQSIEESQDRALDGDARRELLLAFQEILNNAVKHARCKTIHVRLVADGDHLLMEVKDDGRGFDPAGAGDGTGLSSLTRRAERLGGACEIQSTPASGTRVTLRIPLKGRWRGRRTPPSLPDQGGAPGHT